LLLSRLITVLCVAFPLIVRPSLLLILLLLLLLLILLLLLLLPLLLLLFFPRHSMGGQWSTTSKPATCTSTSEASTSETSASETR
jgi:hypothetical protein